MAADLAAVDRERRDLVATVSHELRTPLAGARRACWRTSPTASCRPTPEHLARRSRRRERLGGLVDGPARALPRSRPASTPLELAPVELARPASTRSSPTWSPRGPRRARSTSAIRAGPQPCAPTPPGSASCSPTCSTTPSATAPPGGAVAASRPTSAGGPGGSRSSTTGRAWRRPTGSGSSSGSAPSPDADGRAAPASGWPIARWVAELARRHHRASSTPTAGDPEPCCRRRPPARPARPPATRTATMARRSPVDHPPRTAGPPCPPHRPPPRPPRSPPADRTPLFGRFWPDAARARRLCGRGGRGWRRGARPALLLTVHAGPGSVLGARAARRRRHGLVRRRGTAGDPFTLACAAPGRAAARSRSLLLDAAWIAALCVLAGAPRGPGRGDRGRARLPGFVLAGHRLAAGRRCAGCRGSAAACAAWPGTADAPRRRAHRRLVRCSALARLRRCCSPRPTPCSRAGSDAVLPDLSFDDLVAPRRSSRVAVFGLMLAAAYLALNPPAVERRRPPAARRLRQPLRVAGARAAGGRASSSSSVAAQADRASSAGTTTSSAPPA